MLRVGFIGLGAISHENVLGYLDASDAQIVAVASRNQADGLAWLDRYRLAAARHYTDYREMLAC
jgi:predicted dehydrogenase